MRWDAYMLMGSEDTQWLSVFVTFLFTLLLTGVVALILKMMLRRDILKYEQLPKFTDDKLDDMGWK